MWRLQGDPENWFCIHMICILNEIYHSFVKNLWFIPSIISENYGSKEEAQHLCHWLVVVCLVFIVFVGMTGIFGELVLYTDNLKDRRQNNSRLYGTHVHQGGLVSSGGRRLLPGTPPPPTSKYYQQHRLDGAIPKAPGSLVGQSQGRPTRHWWI